jgi:hypothetical protein
MDKDTLEIVETKIPITDDMDKDIGTFAILPHGDEIWAIPPYSTIIRRWNPKTNEVKSYDKLPEDFKCDKEKYPFDNIVFYKNRAYISPGFGNMYLVMDIDTGEIEQWNPPECVSQKMCGKNEYYATDRMGGFLYDADENGNCLIWSASDRRLFSINLETKDSKEIKIKFDINVIRRQEQGFDKISYNVVYGCFENVFNSLDNLINGNIVGNQYNKEKQIEAYKAINASPNGDCGEKVYRYLESLL